MSLGYALVRGLARFLLGLFYARIEVVGAAQIPLEGPLIVAANHHNSVVDAMLLLAVIPRRLRTLANAPLFKHPLIGPFLRLLGALPVHRRQEAGNDPARNTSLFDISTAALRSGGAILIFPEGRTQPEPVLLELRTGAARMLLAAEKDGSRARVTLLPVGLIFHEPGTFRAGRALVWIGKPVPTADCMALATAHPEDAARALTLRLAEALRGQIVEADDRRTLRLLGVAEDAWRAETGTAPADGAARVDWLQRAMRTYRRLLEREPARIAAFERQLDGFAADLERVGLAGERVYRPYSAGAVIAFVLREGFSLLVAAPLALVGIVAHAVPYQLTAAVVRRIPHTDEEDATDKIAAGLVLYPLAWAVEAWGVYRLGGGWAMAVFLAALLPVGFLALAWRERLDRAKHEARALIRFLRDRDSLGRLRDRRSALVAELQALGRLTPEDWS